MYCFSLQTTSQAAWSNFKVAWRQALQLRLMKTQRTSLVKKRARSPLMAAKQLCYNGLQGLLCQMRQCQQGDGNAQCFSRPGCYADPFVVGRPYGLRQLRRGFEHILQHRERLWLTRPRDICAYVESLPPGIVPGSA
jgi:hypothetical protein